MATTEQPSTAKDYTATTPAKGTAPISKPTQNDNVVTVNIQADKPASQCPSITSTIVELAPRPLRLEVETATDWAIVSVGFAGILSSIIIARYTSRLQANQIKANIANLRQRWIEELRECATSFIERATYISNRIDDQNDYLSSSESTEAFSAMVSAKTKLSLMLDMKHERNQKITTLSHEIIDCIKKHHQERQYDEITRHSHEFESLVRDALDEAWRDIKYDLLATPWYKLIFQRARREA